MDKDKEIDANEIEETQETVEETPVETPAEEPVETGAPAEESSDKAEEAKESEEPKETKEPKIKKPLKNPFKGKKPKIKVNFSESYDKFQTSIPAFLAICLCAFALMCFAAFAIFFMNVKGPEKHIRAKAHKQIARKAGMLVWNLS